MPGDAPSHWSVTRTLTGHGGMVRTLAVSPDERLLASASDGGEVRLWDRKTGECKRLWMGDDLWQELVFLEGGNLLACASSETLRLWSVSSGELVTSFRGERLAIAAVPGSSVLAFGTMPGDVTLLDVLRLRNLGSVHLVDVQVETLAVSPDGRTVVAAGDGAVAAMDVGTLTRRWHTRGHDRKILTSQVAVHPATGRVLSTSHDSTARIWDLETGAQIAVLENARNVGGGAFSPDGRMVFTYANRNALWETTSWTRMTWLTGGAGFITKGAFSPDGSLVFAVDYHGVVRIWEAPSGQEMTTIRVGKKKKVLFNLVVCDEGRELITCSEDKNAYILRRSP